MLLLTSLWQSVLAATGYTGIPSKYVCKTSISRGVLPVQAKANGIELGQ